MSDLENSNRDQQSGSTSASERFLAAAMLLTIACVLSGAYGAAHNQISYSISPEYFTKFKFPQFQISPHLHDRFGAALVGCYATWWMGIVIGLFLIPAGLLIRNDHGFFIEVIRAFMVVVRATLASGFLGFIVAFVLIRHQPTEEWIFRGQSIVDAAAFRRAGILHNFSYIGGLVGIVLGLRSILRCFLAENDRLNQEGKNVEETRDPP